jgi:hypothetical protein
MKANRVAVGTAFQRLCWKPNVLIWMILADVRKWVSGKLHGKAH